MPSGCPRLRPGGPVTSVCLYPTARCVLYVCLCGLTSTPVVVDAQTTLPARPNDLVAMDPRALAQWLHDGRPAPASAHDKARALSVLPLSGEVTDLDRAALTKLAGLRRVLQATARDSTYVVKVIDVPQAAFGLYDRAVLMISKAALGLLNRDEVQAFAAHEVGHEYVWDEHARAVAGADSNRVKELELLCDAIASVILHPLGIDSSRLVSGIEKVSRFNRERFGTALNEHYYPTVRERRVFARRLRAWLTDSAAPRTLRER